MASARRSGLVCFTNADIAFDYVINAVKELKKAGYIKVIAVRKVSNDHICSNNTDPDDFQFGMHEYDFAKSLGASLRHFMLESTGLTKYFDPVYGVRSKLRNTSKRLNFTNEYHPTDTPDNKKFTISQNRIIAEFIAGEYDRMYTAYNIRQRISENHNAKVFETSASSLMYVVDLENKLLYEISTFCKINHIYKDQHIYKCLKPQVNCVKVKVNASELELEGMPYYVYLRNLIRQQKAKENEDHVETILLTDI